MRYLAALYTDGCGLALQARFGRDAIYSSVGSHILVALNPHKPLPQLYTDDIKEACEAQPEQPHVFSSVERIYRRALANAGPQSLVVSGESGAGKTETAKLALSYLIWRTRHANSDVDELRALAIGLQQANPLLEAMGNASTAHNANSSRFGRCTRLRIDPAGGALLGGQVQTFLLEKSRITMFRHSTTAAGQGAPTEGRNYHCFYQLMAASKISSSKSMGAGPSGVDFRPFRLGLSAAAYDLTSSAEQLASGVAEEADLAAFTTMRIALRAIGVSADEEGTLLAALAAIIHLGNVRFAEHRADGKTGEHCVPTLP